MANTDPTADDLKAKVLDLNKWLLSTIANNDLSGYLMFVDPSATFFEPEAKGNLVEGLDFHSEYFRLSNYPAYDDTRMRYTMVRPHVRLLGHDTVAVVCYTLLFQQSKPNKEFARPQTISFEETRIWKRQDSDVPNRWKNVHAHRSHPAK